MSDNYNSDLEDIVAIINDDSISYDNGIILDINFKGTSEALDKTEKLIKKIKSKRDEIEEDRFNKIISITQKIIEVLQQSINFKIKELDPTPPGFASQQSNRLSKNYKNIKKSMGIDKNDEGLFFGIIGVLSKPLTYFINIFKNVTPDRWRIATTKEKVKLAAGIALTLVGLACIIAAVVLTVTTPIGVGAAVIGGVGVTVFYSSIGLGLAAAFGVGIGAAFLDNAGKSVSSKMKDKKEFLQMSDRCKKCNDNLNVIAMTPSNRIKTDIRDEAIKEKDTLTFTRKMDEQLDKIETNVLDIKIKLNPGVGQG